MAPCGDGGCVSPKPAWTSVESDDVEGSRVAENLRCTLFALLPWARFRTYVMVRHFSFG